MASMQEYLDLNIARNTFLLWKTTSPFCLRQRQNLGVAVTTSKIIFNPMR
jgi:hypothetical protein